MDRRMDEINTEGLRRMIAFLFFSSLVFRSGLLSFVLFISRRGHIDRIGLAAMSVMIDTKKRNTAH